MLQRLRSRHRLPLACLLAGLLLVAQALGLAHRVAHGGPAVIAQQAAWGADHEAGGAVCQLVDQLAHADALCGDPGPLGALSLPQAAPAVARAAAPAARTATAYLARGPPAA